MAFIQGTFFKLMIYIISIFQKVNVVTGWQFIKFKMDVSVLPV